MKRGESGRKQRSSAGPLIAVFVTAIFVGMIVLLVHIARTPKADERLAVIGGVMLLSIAALSAGFVGRRQ